MVKISIIIPVYNVGDYIARCLESVLAQSFSDFEVICVDDGSTDSSGDICDEYAGRDSRIRVFHISNQGVGNARNYALDRMRGDWFAFVDSDDWIEPDFLSILYNNAIEYDCTVSACTFQRNTTYKSGYSKDNIKTIVLDSSEACIHNFICLEDSMEGMACNKLYRADVYGNVRFNVELKVNEDCLYTYEIMKCCKKACYYSAQLYHWFFRPESASQTKKLEKNFASANVFLELYEKTKSLADEEVSNILKYDYVSAVIKMLLYSKHKSFEADVINSKKQCKKWRTDVWPLFKAKEKIKYIAAIYLSWLLQIRHLGC